MPKIFADPARITDLASVQWGLFTTAQVRRRGVSAQTVARLTDSGYLERIRHGVYRISGSPPTPRDRLRAAWLALNPALTVQERLDLPLDAVVSHLSAAELHQLGDVAADQVEFTSAQRRQTRDHDVKFHRGTVDRADWTIVDGLPVTTPQRTIADLAQSHVDGEHLGGVVRDAIATLHVGVDDVAGRLTPFAHSYGAALSDGRGLVADLLRTAGLPTAIICATELISRPEQQGIRADLQLRPTPWAVEVSSLSPHAESASQRDPGGPRSAVPEPTIIPVGDR
jgi:predicted transcriptional regulator of viral defense system